MKQKKISIVVKEENDLNIDGMHAQLNRHEENIILVIPCTTINSAMVIYNSIKDKYGLRR